MFNRIGLILIIASLISCSRSADIISAPKSTVDRVNFQALNVNGSDYESDIRSVTLLAYPNASDLANFSFGVEDRYKDLFKARYVDYKSEQKEERFLLSQRASSMQLGIPMDMAGAVKYSTIVNQIISVGFLRDAAFKEQLITEEVQDEMYSDIETMFEELSFFAVLDEEGTYKLEADLTTDSESEEFYDCEEYTESVEVLITTAGTQSIKETIDSECKSYDKATAQVELLMNDIYGLGEGYVLEMLGEVQKASGRNFLTTTMAIDRDSDEYSQISISEDGSSVEGITLYTDINDGTGYNEYSTENGKISNVKFYTSKSGAKLLEFEMKTSLYTVKTKLGMTVMDYYDLRFVGDATFFYNDGQVRDGVMKIEVNKAEEDDDWDF